MNSAKNGKSSLENIFDLIRELTDEQRTAFTQNKSDHDYIILFERIIELIVNDNIFDTVDKEKLKVGLGNFTKLTSNLYGKLIHFITEEFKKDNWIKWQMEANDKLLQIEALSHFKMNSQAVNEFLKLEADLKLNKPENTWSYNDYTIFSRMANLKLRLKMYTIKDLGIDHTDQFLSKLMQLFENLYNEKIPTPYPHSFDKNRMLGFYLLTQYFLEKQDFLKAEKIVSNQIEIIKNTSNREFRNSDESQIMINFNLMYLAFLKMKNGKTLDYNDFNLEGSKNLGILGIMFLEQIFYEMKICLGIQRNKIKEIGKVFSEIDTFGLYQSKVSEIETFEIRKEFNQSILLYLKGDYLNCSKNLEQIKKVKKVESEKHLYLKISFLQLLCSIKDFKINEDINRNIRITIKKIGNLDFENEAIILLESYENYGKPYIIKNKEKLDSLISKKDELNVMHNLIIATLQGNC